MAEHKHADVLRAIADGKVVQWQSRYDNQWNDLAGRINPIGDHHLNWRVKSEPKPDVVRYGPVHTSPGYETIGAAKIAGGDTAIGYVRITIAGETGKLKSVEIVE